MKMTEEERQEKIEQIVTDCGTCYDYKDFAADCVRQVVSKWSDQELMTWFGIEDEEDSEGGEK